MRHGNHTIAFALAWALTASTSGCAAKRVSPATQPTALGVSATRPTALNVPIVYSSYFKPEPLNDAQRHEINALIAEAMPKVGEPWFVYVRYSRDGTYRVAAYFRPTGAQGAVRRGEAIFVDNQIPIDQRRQVVRELGGQWPTTRPYVQVARAGSADGDDVQYDGALTPPPETQLPFEPPPAGMSDKELTAAVDCARTALAKESDGREMPLHHIEKADEATVRVYFGWLAGPLNGRGRFIELKRNGDGFRAEGGIGIWRS